MGIFLSRILKGLQYSLYLIFHPFKGFWDLKHEKKGNVYSAWVIVCLLSILLILRRQFTGFILNFNKQNEMNVFVEILSVLAPLGLWCLSNWCITTLVDGEGSLKDIFITTAYALTPVVLINIPMLLLSNVMILEETVFYTVLDALSVLWAALLILIGIMTVHQFTMPKTIATIAVAVVGMIIILFLILLFVSIIQQIVSFVDPTVDGDYHANVIRNNDNGFMPLRSQTAARHKA